MRTISEIKIFIFEIKSGNFDIKKSFWKIKVEMFKPGIESSNKIIKIHTFFSFDTPRTPYVFEGGPCNEPQFNNYLLRKIQNKQKWHKIGFFQFLFWILKIKIE